MKMDEWYVNGSGHPREAPYLLGIMCDAVSALPIRDSRRVHQFVFNVLDLVQGAAGVPPTQHTVSCFDQVPCLDLKEHRLICF